MARNSQLVQWFRGCTKLTRAAACAVLGLALLPLPVLAQFGGRQGGFFDFFGPSSGPRYAPFDQPAERPVDYSRAPSPRKSDTQSANTVLVLGDSMADWLAYGLEEAFADDPEIGVIRRHRTVSGLIRYDSRNETQDWAHAAREAIAATKPKFVVMMLGLHDRQTIRERSQQPGSATAPGATPPEALDAERPQSGQSSIVAPEQQSQGRGGLRVHEFRSDSWAESYSTRIDGTIAAMKSGGVPVFWVALPSIRGTKSTSDAQYLNDLYRARAEKAGINYIDVWDGFIDENGRFVAQGPDVDGQTRRLRAGDGVHFTKAGARKLAHFLEREIRRMTARGVESVALPAAEPQTPAPAPRPSGPSGAAVRPLSGPVLPLTAAAPDGQNLIGGDAGVVSKWPTVTRVLVIGEPPIAPAGRADDFRWPRRGIAPFGTDPVVATTNDPIPVMQAAPATTTVPVPGGDARPSVSASAPRIPRRDPAQARSEPRGFQGFSFPFFR
jgi:uncharacterized protein